MNGLKPLGNMTEIKKLSDTGLKGGGLEKQYHIGDWVDGWGCIPDELYDKFLEEDVLISFWRMLVKVGEKIKRWWDRIIFSN